MSSSGTNDADKHTDTEVSSNVSLLTKQSAGSTALNERGGASGAAPASSATPRTHLDAAAFSGGATRTAVDSASSPPPPSLPSEGRLLNAPSTSANTVQKRL